MARWRRLEPGPLLGVVLVAHLVLALVLGVRALGLIERLELQAYDAWLGWRAAASPAEERIVIVPVSDADWQGWMGQRFLPDRELADALEVLGEAGAIAIGLDLIRDRPEPGSEGGPPDYERLRGVLEAHPVIGVWSLGDDGGRGVAPPPALADRPQRLGLGDVLPDRDGVVRRAPLFLNGHETLAFQLAERWLERHGVHPEPGEGPLRLLGRDYTPLRLGRATYVALGPADGGYAGTEPGGYQLLLSFPACARPLPAIPLRRLLDEPAAVATEVAGRLVLIGSRTTEQKDWLQIPVPCHGPAARLGWGVDLHAQLTSQLIREALGEARPLVTPGQALRDPLLGQIADGGWIWLWTLLGGVAVVALPSTPALAAGALVLAGALIGATLALFTGVGWWLPVVPPLLGLAGAMALGLGYTLARERRRWAILLDRVSAYVSRRIVTMIAGRRGGPETREVMASVLFSDIRGSTAIAEALPEPELMAWLNEYMSVMADLVLAHGGEIEKFAGDGITASFSGSEVPASEAQVAADARAAVDCALAMGRELARLNAAWRERGLPAIGIRVGIHTGPLMVGNIGSRRRMQYSIIGDTANTAARLEAWGKDEAARSDPDHCRILVSEATWQRLGEGYHALPVGTLQLKGKRLPMEVVRIVGGPLPAAPAQAREPACRV